MVFIPGMQGIPLSGDRRTLAFVLILLLCATGISLEAQNVGAPKGLRIDPSLPFVYLKFDHIGEGARVMDNEPPTRIWLRFANNCRLPIVVVARGKKAGGLKDEVFLDGDVVQNRQRSIMITESSAQEEPLPAPMEKLIMPGQNSSQQTSSASQETKSEPPQKPSNDDKSEMPVGYPSGDVVSYETIKPGENLLFSIPVSFVSKKWHFEVGFDFDSEDSNGIPETHSFSRPDVRGSVQMTLIYGFWDLPEERRAEVERLNQSSKPIQ